MILLNFSHPLTAEQLAQVETLAGQSVDRMLGELAQFDHAAGFAEQVRGLVERAGLAADEWQTAPLLVNLPGYAPGAACLLAEIHGRAGYFPAILRLRPVAGSVVTVYEVAELINLQAMRETARYARSVTPAGSEEATK